MAAEAISVLLGDNSNLYKKGDDLRLPFIFKAKILQVKVGTRIALRDARAILYGWDKF